MVESSPFGIFTGHKPLTYAFQQRRDKCSPRKFRHLEFIGQFSTDFRHVSGQDNIVADALSRAKSVITPFNFHGLGGGVARHPEYGLVLRLERMQIPGTDIKSYCDTSTPQPQLFTNTPFRRQVFDSLHELSHPVAIAS
jgi:hypothetical protein